MAKAGVKSFPNGLWALVPDQDQPVNVEVEENLWVVQLYPGVCCVESVGTGRRDASNAKKYGSTSAEGELGHNITRVCLTGFQLLGADDRTKRWHKRQSRM